MYQLLIVFSVQEGKTVAIMALESGFHANGYICFLLVAAAGADLEEVDPHHKSHVSFFALISFLFFDTVVFFSSSLSSSAKYGGATVFLLKLHDSNLFIEVFMCAFVNFVRTTQRL